MEKLVLLMLLLAGICAVASGHFRKYHFVKDKKSWFDAQSYCREKHTDLATIESQEEIEKLNISAGFTDAWIGLYYDKENWQWSSRDNVSYYNWTSSLNCTSVDSKGEWVDSDCHDNKHFMCYNETRESYILIDQSKTWYDAQQYCRKNYTDLVSIKNNDEDKKIKEKVNGNPVWIGLFNNPWKWSHKGEYSSFHNWDKGEPNNLGNNICVEMYGTANQERGKWNDAGCHNISPFFCYNESCTDASCTKYHFVKTDMNWSAAQTHCRDKYTDLATVHSQEEAKQLLDILNISANAWIGIYRDGNENWQWSNGDAVTYNMRRTKLFCATVNPDGDWTDSVCHDKKHFMCYDSHKETSERYILIEQLKTWYEAQQYCREHHTDLVSVKNEDENNKIKEKANGTAVWIGLFNNPWKWSDGGDNYTLQNWSENQPDIHKGKDKCVVIQNKSNKLTLNDDPCSTAYPFFCYDDGKKLFLVKENKTWEEAVEYCRSNHTDLVSIESEEEHNRVSQEANEASSSHVWLGLLQSCTFGFWYWVDGAQSCYDNWTPEPRCQSGCNQCGVMTAKNGSKWTEKPCTERFNFICYNGTTGSSH